MGINRIWLQAIALFAACLLGWTLVLGVIVSENLFLNFFDPRAWVPIVLFSLFSTIVTMLPSIKKWRQKLKVRREFEEKFGAQSSR